MVIFQVFGRRTREPVEFFLILHSTTSLRYSRCALNTRLSFIELSNGSPRYRRKRQIAAMLFALTTKATSIRSVSRSHYLKDRHRSRDQRPVDRLIASASPNWGSITNTSIEGGHETPAAAMPTVHGNSMNFEQNSPTVEAGPRSVINDVFNRHDLDADCGFADR